MIVRLVSIILLSLSLCVGMGQSSPLTLLQKKMNPIRTLQGDFTQTLEDSSSAPRLTGSGRFYIERPHLFLWVTKKPGEQKILIRHKQVFVYDVDLQQVTIQTLQGDIHGLTPASLLSGDITGLDKTNTVTHFRDHGADIFRLVPKTLDQDDLKWLQILFDGDQLLGLQFENQLNQVTVVHFKHVKLNRPISPSRFRLSYPADVDIIRND